MENNIQWKQEQMFEVHYYIHNTLLHILKAKKEKHLECVKEYYGYSNEKAKSALSILNDEQIKTIMNSLNKGGKHGK